MNKQKIWLSSPHMGGNEAKFVTEAFDSNWISPLGPNVNGFEMGVVTEPTTNSLKRRKAIARNKSGVVMLKGEFSFSSIDQILIDELVFYIQQNDLKAD